MIVDFVAGHLVSATIFLPLATALALFVASAAYKLTTGTPGLPPMMWRGMALSGSTLTFLLASFGLFRRFDP